MERIWCNFGTYFANLKDPSKKAEIEKDLTLIKNEILKEQKFLKGKYKFDGIEQLNPKDYTPEIGSSLKVFLEK